MFYDFKNSLQRHKKRADKVIPKEVLKVRKNHLIAILWSKCLVLNELVRIFASLFRP